MKFSPVCKSFLMMLCTDEREMCALRAVSQNTTMAVCAVFLIVHKQACCFQYNVLTMVDHYWQGVQHYRICPFFPTSDLNHHKTISCSEIL